MYCATYSSTTRQGRVDINSWAEDVDDRAVVAARVSVVVFRSATDRADILGRSRRHIRGVNVVVARSNGDEEALLGEGIRGIVEGLGVAAAKGHVDHHSVRAVSLSRIRGDVLHARDDGRVGPEALAAPAVVVEHLDAVKLRLLGDAVASAADGAGDVGAVSTGVGLGVGDK